jgi:hypothetical protein
MRNWTLVLFWLAAVPLVSAGTKSAGNLSACEKKGLFIDPMPENFGQYVTTEILAQGLGVEITTEREKVVCVMRGTVALGGFRNTGSASIQIIGPTSTVIWSATSGDKDSVKDLAHNLVKQLKRDFQSSPRPK